MEVEAVDEGTPKILPKPRNVAVNTDCCLLEDGETADDIGSAFRRTTPAAVEEVPAAAPAPEVVHTPRRSR